MARPRRSSLDGLLLCQRLIRKEAVLPAVLIAHTVLRHRNWRRFYPAPPREK